MDTQRLLVGFAGGLLVACGVKRRSPSGVLLAAVGVVLGGRAVLGHHDLTTFGTWLRRLTATPEPTVAADLVEETSEESFPASDAPAWTPVTGPRA